MSVCVCVCVPTQDVNNVSRAHLCQVIMDSDVLPFAKGLFDFFPQCVSVGERNGFDVALSFFSAALERSLTWLISFFDRRREARRWASAVRR